MFLPEANKSMEIQQTERMMKEVQAQCPLFAGKTAAIFNSSMEIGPQKFCAERPRKGLAFFVSF